MFPRRRPHGPTTMADDIDNDDQLLNPDADGPEEDAIDVEAGAEEQREEMEEEERAPKKKKKRDVR